MQGMSSSSKDKGVVMDRVIRAPFNGMRGKKDDTDENDMHRQLVLKRAPFNGMRGKRGPFNRMWVKRGEEEEGQYMGERQGLKVS